MKSIQSHADLLRYFRRIRCASRGLTTHEEWDALHNKVRRELSWIHDAAVRADALAMFAEMMREPEMIPEHAAGRRHETMRAGLTNLIDFYDANGSRSGANEPASV